ncbi:uncharacterized protein LOC110691593 [Chenopodium quinoa]|uniref:uncharacterized protein LOC110691593 n=1 Tax=Chenopodium quinoa TaxID=63459 RepID=UPI000B79529F|nr:uncharacterized protein LOC110691593 [Chenopodium quinoa]
MFEPPMHPKMMGFMNFRYTLKYCIIKLRRGASCLGGSSDVLESDGGLARARGTEARTRESLVAADDILRFVGILSLSGSLRLLNRFMRLSGSSLSLLSHSRTFRAIDSGLHLPRLYSMSSG